MGGNDGIVLWNEAESRQERVPADKAEAALASGKYRPFETSRTFEVDGLPVTRSATGLGGVADRTARERAVDPNRDLGERLAREREAALSDPWLTFVEAAVDTATLGLVHERGEEADIRRAADSKAAFAGGLVGFLTPGPGVVTSAGRAAGAAAARKLLGKTTGVLAGGVKEGVAGAAVMGAIAMGQQVSDAALTDHKFNGEAVLSHVGMGALLGGITGAALSPLERLAPGGRGKVAESGGLLDPKSPESLKVSSTFRGAVGSLDDAVLEYERMAAAARVLRREDPSLVPVGAVERAEAAIRRAQASGRKLAAMDFDRVLAGEDMALRERFHRALERYEADVSAVDAAFAPRPGEVRPLHRPGELRFTEGRAPGGLPDVVDERGFAVHEGGTQIGDVRSSVARDDIFAAPFTEIEGRMVSGRQLRERYRELYGREYEPIGGGPSLVGEENLGGRVTPTSEGATGAGSGRARARVAETPREVSAPYESVEIGRATERGMPATRAPGPRRTPGLEGRVDDLLAGQEALTIRGQLRDHLDARIAERRALGIEPDPVRSAATAPIRIPEVGSRARVQKYLDAKGAARREVLGEPRVTEVGPGIEPRAPAEPVRPASADVTAEMRAVGDPAAPGPAPRTPEDLYPAIGRPVPLEVPTGARAIVEDLWRQRNAMLDPRPTAAQRAAAKMQALSEEIRAGAGGGLDSAAAVDLLRNEGHRPAASALGAQVDQIIAARRIARALADESRGAANDALRESGRKSLLSWVGKQVTTNAARRAVAGSLGWTVGGPVGALLGAAFAKKIFGTAGRVAAAGGTTAATVTDSVKRALSRSGGGLGGALARATASYDDGPRAEDPAVRAAQLRSLAANPDVVRERVRAALGDDGLLHPDVTAQLEEKAVHQITNLSVRAPVFVMDALGRQRPVDPEAVRRWESYERATHDLPGVLRKFAAGTLTGPEAEALEQFPEVRNRLIATALADQEALRNAPQDRLQFLERVLQIPLTTAHDPAHVARQQMNWGPPPPPPTTTPPTPPPATPAQSPMGAP